MKQWNQVIFAQASMMEGKSVKSSVLAVFALYNGNTANTVYFESRKRESAKEMARIINFVSYAQSAMHTECLLCQPVDLSVGSKSSDATENIL